MATGKRASSRFESYEMQLYTDGNAALQETEDVIQRRSKSSGYKSRTSKSAKSSFAEKRQEDRHRGLNRRRSRMDEPIYSQAVPKYEEEYHAPPEYTTSLRVRKNRSRALRTGRGYVIFFALASAITLFSCVYYLNLRTTVSSQYSELADLENQLLKVRSEATVLEERVESSIDHEEIERVARQKGMDYPNDDHTFSVAKDETSTYQQVRDLPE